MIKLYCILLKGKYIFSSSENIRQAIYPIDTDLYSSIRFQVKISRFQIGLQYFQKTQNMNFYFITYSRTLYFIKYHNKLQRYFIFLLQKTTPN